MKIYAFSGLGADKRAFEFLKLNCELIPIDWIDPIENESIQNYSHRLSKLIDTKDEFGLMGVSFGGLVAIEISKILNPRITILISSIATKNELRLVFKLLRKIRLMKILPLKAYDPPRKVTEYIFGASDKQLLNNILDDTNLKFAKWAVNEFINWTNADQINNTLRIHGTNDKLIPWKGKESINLIADGEHFMIIDRANEISQIINDKINYSLQHTE